MKRNSIPKVIHYCWFGRGELSELSKKCIASWKRKLPDYEIKEWNEDNFDLHCNKYVEQAYEAKKYAFVTDYVRLFALYHEGGIYMDTDVEVLKPLDQFLIHPAFSGFENNNSIPTGIIASVKHNECIKKLLDDYNDISFILENGTMDMTTNVTRITNTINNNYDIKLDDTYQDLGDIVFYPHDYFCPKDWETGQIYITKNTYTIHHFNGSWHNKDEKKILEKKKKFIEKYGVEKGLKKYKYYQYFTYPIKIIKNPKKVVQKLKKIIKH